MKNILIVGPSRAGKTTLAKALSRELGCFVLSLDKLVAVFQAAYPQLDIRLNWDRDRTSANLAPFIGSFLAAQARDSGSFGELNLHAHSVEGSRFLLEGGYFDFAQVDAAFKAGGAGELGDSFILIGLTQCGKSAEAFFRDLRRYDTPEDWTYGLSDAELRDYIERDALSYNREMAEELARYGFRVYDTSAERERVIAGIVEDVRAELRR